MNGKLHPPLALNEIDTSIVRNSGFNLIRDSQKTSYHLYYLIKNLGSDRLELE